MRIIHTADWHLCDRLGRLDRTADLRDRVEKIAHLCEENRADVLLIAGDLFYENASVDEMSAALRHMHEVFQPFFARNGTILAITGNHDRDGKINLIRSGMTLASPVPLGGHLLPGRMYLQNGLSFCSLAHARTDVQFVLVPYPFAHRYDLLPLTNHEEQNRQLQGHLAHWIREVSTRETFDQTRPTVLAAHLHLRGSETHTLYKISERDDVIFEPGFLPATWAYVALGHIHRAQSVNGNTMVRYPGSLDRLDFGEMHDERGVLLLDVAADGSVDGPHRLSLDPTTFHDVVIDDPAVDMPLLELRFPDHASAIVRVTVPGDMPGPSRDEINRDLRRVFPRLHEISWSIRNPDSGERLPANYTPRADFGTTVREFVTRRLQDDPNLPGVLGVLDGFLAQEIAS